MPRITKSVKEGKRIIPYYQVGILFPDGKKIVKARCTLEEALETYFLNLDKFKDKYTAEQLVELYKKNYSSKGIKTAINYIDSWGHKWTGKVAFPKDDVLINYLNNRT